MRSEPRHARTSVWALSVSLAATSKITVVFSSSGYLDVSVHRVPFVTLWIHVTIHEGFSCGFPHSDICGSMCICHSPQLFAAYHVFHRLLVPRHPPCALVCFSYLEVVNIALFTSFSGSNSYISIRFCSRMSLFNRHFDYKNILLFCIKFSMFICA